MTFLGDSNPVCRLFRLSVSLLSLTAVYLLFMLVLTGIPAGFSSRGKGLKKQKLDKSIFLLLTQGKCFAKYTMRSIYQKYQWPKFKYINVMNHYSYNSMKLTSLIIEKHSWLSFNAQKIFARVRGQKQERKFKMRALEIPVFLQVVFIIKQSCIKKSQFMYFLD